MFPPIPTSWDSVHPLIIHFPIALLMIAPLFVLIGLILRKHGKAFAITGLILMVLGTISTWVAVSTGEAAGAMAIRTPEINAALEHHEELAESTRLLFTLLTATFALLLGVPLLLKRELKPILTMGLQGAFLLFYLGCTIVLVNTAHMGGILVHEYGVHAMLPLPKDQAASLTINVEGAHDED